MPCDGPSKEYAYEQGNKIADEILAYLLANHDINRNALAFDSSKKEWDEQAEKIREAIKEMVWIDHAEF
jgi:hypothetical protein